VDTDAAYKTALAKAAEYDKKNPNLTISMLLEKNKQYPNPAWRMIWGESGGLPVCRCSSTRSTGEFLETLHWTVLTGAGATLPRRARKPSGVEPRAPSDPGNAPFQPWRGPASSVPSCGAMAPIGSWILVRVMLHPA